MRAIDTNAYRVSRRARLSRMACTTAIMTAALMLFVGGCAKPVRQFSPGKFSLLQGPPLAGHFLTIAAGDFDGDGHTDLVAGNSVPTGHDLVIWYGAGDGTWNRMVKLPVYGAVHSLAIGDVNNDGLEDICLSVWERSLGIIVWLNRGNDLWQQIHSPSRSGLYDGIRLQDLNGDGRDDIIAANYSLETGIPGGIHVWLSKEAGGWSNNLGPIGQGRFANVTIADLNLDGSPDIAGTSWGPDGQCAVWLGRERMQNWAAMPPLDAGNFWGIESADINNDGIPDLVTSTYKEGIRIYYGDCTGLFSPAQVLTDIGHFWNVLPCDLNGDGWLDILASTFDDHGINVWINTGAGEYKEWNNQSGHMKIGTRTWKPMSGLLPNYGSFYQMLIDDFDQDGHMDLAAAHRGQGVKVWMNLINSDQIAGLNAELLIDPNVPAMPETRRVAQTVQSNGLVSSDRFEEHFLIGDAAGAPRRKSNGNPSNGNPSNGNTTKRDANHNVNAESSIEENEPGYQVNSGHSMLAAKMDEDKENQVFRMINGVAEYIIGPGDIVEITFWEAMDAKVYTVTVKPDGAISTPFFEDFKIGGLTAFEVDQLLTRKMRRFMHNPKIDVRIIEFNSKRATVLGAIARPSPEKGAGTYNLTGKTRVLEFVARAGGPGPDADLKRVEVIHRGETKKLNLYKAIFQADFTQNIVVDNDDVIFIPRITDTSSKVYIFGEINSPGIYTFSGPFTVLDAIAMAKGYGKDARIDSIKVVRGDLANPEVIPCNLSDIIKKGDIISNVHLMNNDLIYVPKSTIANMKLFVEKVDSLLKLVLYPVALVNTIKDPEDLELRLDVGY